MTTEVLTQQSPYAERDLLSAIGILQSLLARHGQADDRRARWRATLNRARMQLESLRNGDGGRANPLPAARRA